MSVRRVVQRWLEWTIAGCMALALFQVILGCRPPEKSRLGPGAPAEAEKAYPAPVFSARSLAKPDQQVALDQFKGKVVLLDFWATWCPPCRHEIPSLNKLYGDYNEKGFEIVGMTVDQGDPSAIAQSVSRLGVLYPAVLADERAQQAFGGIRVVPTKFLLDKEGNIRKFYQGMVSEEVLRAEIEALLAL